MHLLRNQENRVDYALSGFVANPGKLQQAGPFREPSIPCWGSEEGECMRDYITVLR